MTVAVLAKMGLLLKFLTTFHWVFGFLINRGLLFLQVYYFSEYLLIYIYSSSTRRKQVEIYCLDRPAKGQGDSKMVNSILQELEVEAEHFTNVEHDLTRRNVTLREIFDNSELCYNQIRAVIVALMYRFGL